MHFWCRFGTQGRLSLAEKQLLWKTAAGRLGFRRPQFSLWVLDTTSKCKLISLLPLSPGFCNLHKKKKKFKTGKKQSLQFQRLESQKKKETRNFKDRKLCYSSNKDQHNPQIHESSKNLAQLKYTRNQHDFEQVNIQLLISLSIK